jgi:hypothetical protein
MRPAAALLLALLLPAVAAAGETLYYRSNAAAMLLERIPPYRRDESPWVLQVDRTAAGETRVLLRDGKESRRWVRISTGAQVEEKEYGEGALVARRVFDQRGSLLQEETWAQGALRDKIIYVYAGGRLIRARAVDASGTELYTDDFLYAVNGSLRSVRRTPAAGPSVQTTVTAGSGGIAEERMESGPSTWVERFDARGRVAAREERDASGLLSREDFHYRADGDALLSSAETRPREGISIDREYDAAGRIQRETTTAKAGVTVLTWVRTADGQVTSKQSRGPDGLETWVYTLRADATVAREEYSRKGTLEKVTIYGDGAQRTEELYTDGELALTVTWDGDVKRREEVWSNGTLVRTRSWP